MSDDRDIIEERGDFRLVIEPDPHPSEPYDDGGSPILRYWGVGDSRFRAEQVTSITPHEVDNHIIDALARFGDSGLPWQTPLFERYLKMFHGARSVQWHDDYRGDYKYVTFDTAGWREKVGLTDEWIAEREAAGEPVVLADMSEYQAYARGEAYGWVVEQKVTLVPVDADGHADMDNTREVWETIDSTWGYYSQERVEQAAREEFTALIEATPPAKVEPLLSDTQAMDAIAAFVNEPGPVSGGDLCQLVERIMPRTGRPILDDDGEPLT